VTTGKGSACCGANSTSVSKGDPTEFAIRLSSIDELFWPLDAAPVARRDLSADVRWALLDDWETVRHNPPQFLTIYAPAADRERTDEAAVRASIHRSLRAASGPLSAIDPLSRHQKIAARLGIAVLFATILVSSALDHVSDDVLVQGISQAIVVVGWVAVWTPAARFVVEVMPHVFNRRRFSEFADIDVRFVWV
jgi:hypothetical protein